MLEFKKLGTSIMKLTWIRINSHSSPSQTPSDTEFFNAVNKLWYIKGDEGCSQVSLKFCV